MELLWLIALFFMAGGKETSTDTPTPPGSSSSPPSGNASKLAELARRADLPEDWTDFFLVVARGESGFNPLVGLGNPALFPPWAQPNTSASQAAQDGEANAARIAYNRNKDRYSAWPADRYSFGSGGFFGLLPGNALAAWWGSELEGADPWLVFEPEAALVFAIAMAKRLTKYDAFKADPRFKRLRAGWAASGLMGKDAFIAGKIEKWRKHAQQAGVSPSLLEAKPSPLPKIDYVALYEHLKGGA